MAFKKGKSGNPSGRPKGAQNKLSGTLKEWLADLLDRNRERIEEDLKALEPRDRLLMLEKLMGYVLPKCKAEEDEAPMFPQKVEIRHVSNDSGTGIASSEEEVMERDGIPLEEDFG